MPNPRGRVECGWKKCYETFANLADMNVHVQHTHMQFSIQLQIQPFYRADNSHFVQEDVKPNVFVANQTPIDLDDDDEENSTSPDSSAIPDTSLYIAPEEVAAPIPAVVPTKRTRTRAATVAAAVTTRVSKYWTIKGKQAYLCKWKDCQVVSTTAKKATSHWNSHNEKSNGPTTSSLSSVSVEAAPDTSTSSDPPVVKRPTRRRSGRPLTRASVQTHEEEIDEPEDFGKEEIKMKEEDEEEEEEDLSLIRHDHSY